AQHLNNGLLQRSVITRGYSRRGGQSTLAYALVKEDDGRQDTAAKESAAVIVIVETEIESRANGVRTVDPAQVVDELRSGNRSLGMGRHAKRRGDVDEGAEDTLIGPRRQLAGSEVRIGFSKGEVESKAVKTGGELVHQVGREYMAIAD